MKRLLLPITLSLFLGPLSFWLLLFSMDQRQAYYGRYQYGDRDTNVLSKHPGVLYGFGQQALAQLDADEAAALFRKVVIRDPLHMDAWLKLAEVEFEMGDPVNAKRIAAFCDQHAGDVLRWKRAHTLLAHDLAMEGIFRRNLNYMLDRKKWPSDLFYLLDIHTNNQTAKALSLLTPGNHPAYLSWLTRWKKEDAAEMVWAAIEAGGAVTDSLLENYVHFLVNQKRIVTASGLWRQRHSISGMTNPGFEKKISNKGFGWRMFVPKEGNPWQGYRAFGQSHNGAHAMRISFHGRENLSWHHIFQVVPVTPEKTHRLTFWGKCKGLSTDQGPFVEIYGYDASGLYEKSAMILGSREWMQDEVVFTPPADCHAVVVRLRRNESLRFDNKIQGVIWVDDFKIELVDRPSLNASNQGKSTYGNIGFVEPSLIGRLNFDP